MCFGNEKCDCQNENKAVSKQINTVFMFQIQLMIWDFKSKKFSNVE